MKSIRKPLCLILSLYLLMALVFTAPQAHADHTHEYGGPWITDLTPTCTTEGRRYTICTAADCSVPPYTKYDVLDALGHTWGVWGPGTPAGCTTPGTTQRVCSRCGDTESMPTAALGHNWGAWTVTVAPSCTTSGSTQRLCSRCGALETASQPALGHVWGAYNIATPATCTLPGMNERVCSRCGDRQQQAVATLGHLWGSYSVITVPACTQPGVNERVCSRCFATQTQVLPALMHLWGPYITVTAPTCNAKGVEEHTCTHCAITQRRDLARLSHVFGAWTLVSPAACGVKGQEKRVCSLCAKEEKRSIPALKHISDNTWAIVKTATLGSRGTQATSCTVCGKQLQTRSYAPRGYRYDAAFRVYGPLAGSVLPSLAGLPDQLIYLDMTQDGVHRFPLVTEDNYHIGEAVLTINGGTLRVSLKQRSEPTRLRDLRWLVFPALEDISSGVLSGFSQPFDRALPIATDSCIVTISGVSNYYQGNENRLFSPLTANPDGLGSYADMELMMLDAMTQE